MTPNRRQFTLRQLMLFTLVYASVFAFVAAFSVPSIQILCAASIVTVFVAVDLCFGGSKVRDIPILSRFSMFVARYASAFTISVVACFFVFFHTLQTAPAPRPSVTFLKLISGEFLKEPIGELVRIILVALIYFGLFMILSTAGLVSSLFALRHFRSARWLLLVNVPGVLLLVWFVVAALLGSPDS